MDVYCWFWRGDWLDSKHFVRRDLEMCEIEQLKLGQKIRYDDKWHKKERERVRRFRERRKHETKMFRCPKCNQLMPHIEIVWIRNE